LEAEKEIFVQKNLAGKEKNNNSIRLYWMKAKDSKTELLMKKKSLHFIDRLHQN
jgi:hypothetical protein